VRFDLARHSNCYARFKSSLSEPTSFVLNVRPYKVLVRFRQIENSFHDSNDPENWPCKTTRDCRSHQTNHEHDNPLGGVAQYKLMNSQRAKNDSEDARQNFFVRSLRLPVCHLTWRIVGLNRLITARRGQRGLTVNAELRRIIVGRAAFGTVSSHF